MFSLLLREKMYIGEACWAFLFGVVIGPYGVNVFNPRAWGDGSDATIDAITLEFTRVVLAIGVFAIGVELPKAYVKSHWKSLFFMLAPVMAWVSPCYCLPFHNLTRVIGVVRCSSFHLCPNPRAQLPLILMCRCLFNTDRSNSCRSRGWWQVCGQKRSCSCSSSPGCRMWLQ